MSKRGAISGASSILLIAAAVFAAAFALSIVISIRGSLLPNWKEIKNQSILESSIARSNPGNLIKSFSPNPNTKAQETLLASGWVSNTFKGTNTAYFGDPDVDPNIAYVPQGDRDVIFILQGDGKLAREGIGIVAKSYGVLGAENTFDGGVQKCNDVIRSVDHYMIFTLVDVFGTKSPVCVVEFVRGQK